MTMASWMRDFVRNHPKYKFDSEISEEIGYDLTVTMDKISRGEIGCPELFAQPETKTSAIVPERCHKMEQEYEMMIKKVTEKQKLKTQVPNGVPLENGVPNGNGVANGNGIANGNGLVHGNGIANGNGVVNGNGVSNGNGLVHGNGVANGNGIAHGNGVANGNGIAHGNGVAHGNGYANGNDVYLSNGIK